MHCFNYRHVDCLHTLFKYRFSGKIVVRSGKLFDNAQRAVQFSHQNRGVDRMPSIAKKRLLRKKYRKHLLTFFQKTKLTQTSQSLQTDLNKLTTKLQLKLMKSVDWSLDGHGNYTSNSVNFRIQSLKTNHFLNSKEICIKQLVRQMIKGSHPRRIELP